MKIPSFAYCELDEKTMTCPIHGGYSFNPLVFKGVTLYDSCPECLKMRRENDNNAEYGKRLKGMNIGVMYADTCFSNFNAYSGELKTHLRTAENFAVSPTGKLVMLGTNGTGKTHLAVSILKRTGGVIYTAFEICVLLRKSYNGDSKEWETLEELCNVRLLVIDEIGRTKGNDWELNWLSHIINKRHENLLPLVLISNRHLGGDCPENGCPNCIEKYFENDVISRIVEDGVVMKFNGDDYRFKKRVCR